jgi:hypothetical protein
LNFNGTENKNNKEAEPAPETREGSKTLGRAVHRSNKRTR